jgi:hypothetical protein
MILFLNIEFSCWDVRAVCACYICIHQGETLMGTILVILSETVQQLHLGLVVSLLTLSKSFLFPRKWIKFARSSMNLSYLFFACLHQFSIPDRRDDDSSRDCEIVMMIRMDA